MCHILGMTAAAGVLEDFPFDDANGTLLSAAANSINAANLWNEDTTDMDNSTVQNGIYHIQKASAVGTPNGFGTNYLDIANVTTGRVWLVAEIDGWHLASGTADPADFDPAEPEEIRFDFLNNDGNAQGGSTVTAEVEIQRNATSGGMEILGAALGAGSSNIAPQSLSVSQSDPFIVVLGLDKNANTYEIHIKSGAGAFLSIGPPGTIDPTRNGNSVRFVANNSFAGAGEFFDIDRVYLTDVNPIPEPQGLALIAVAAANLLVWRRRP
jgi:hypothetical protein